MLSGEVTNTNFIVFGLTTVVFNFLTLSEKHNIYILSEKNIFHLHSLPKQTSKVYQRLAFIPLPVSKLHRNIFIYIYCICNFLILSVFKQFVKFLKCFKIAVWWFLPISFRQQKIILMFSHRRNRFSFCYQWITIFLEKKLAWSFNFMFRYIDDVLSLNNSRF